MKNILKKYYLHIIIAIILLQTLLYKFTGHPESVALFTQIELFNIPELYGRIIIGIVELIVVIGLFIKESERESLFGVMTLMIGAIYFHTTSIGFAGNNLALFISGCVALLCAIIIYIKKYIKIKNTV